MYKKTVNLRYLSAKIKIEDENGKLKMQINKKNKPTNSADKISRKTTNN